MDKDSDLRQLQLMYMFRELVVARGLFVEGYLDQAAYHLAMSWYALACRAAGDRKEPTPPLDTFTVNTEELPRQGRVQKQGQAWQESLECVLSFVRPPVGAQAFQQQAAVLNARPEQQKRLRGHIQYQLRAAEEIHRRLYWSNVVTRGRILLARSRRRLFKASLALFALGILGGGFWLFQSQEAAPPRLTNHSAAWAPDPGERQLKLDKLGAVKESFTDFNERGNHPFASTVVIELGMVSHARGVDTSLDSNDTYILEFLRQGKVVGRLTSPKNPAIHGLRRVHHAIPEPAVASGFDHIRVRVAEGDNNLVLGHLKLLDTPPISLRRAGRHARPVAPPPTAPSAPSPRGN